MDELADSLGQSFSIAKQDGSFSTDKLHPRFDQFKMKSNPQSQNARRREQLDRQKVRRYDAQLVARKIAEDKLSDIEDMLVDEKEEMESAQVSSYSSRKNQKIPRLMLSEWLVEVPEDSATSCYVVPCPVGKRNLVTSVKGYTTASTKYGVPVQYQIPTALPNGNKTNCSRSHAYTILDCIYSPPENKFFCLDVLCWNGHPFLDCETEFRFCWLKSKFEENPHLAERSRFNKSPFERLPFFPCTKDGILQAITHFPPHKLDGLWFFHKEAHYHLAVTPLVGWLKPFMVPEILHVEIPEEYQQKATTSLKPQPKRKLPVRKNESAIFDAAIKNSGTLDTNENYCSVKSKTVDDSHHSKDRESEDVSSDFDTLLAQTLKDYDEELQNTERTDDAMKNLSSSKKVSNFETESDW